MKSMPFIDEHSDKEITTLLNQESIRQQTTISLIASENYTSDQVRAAAGSVLTNKYAEGYPGKRYYAGCAIIDQIEQIAIDRAKKLFGAEHANVQPHSGSSANMAVYHAALQPGDTILGMNLAEGGHLTHGHAINFSGKLYNVVSYGVDSHSGLLDYDVIEQLAKQHKPKLIIAGASAYARTIDFARFSNIAKSVGALLLADIAHIAGLVATGLHPSPVGYADFITTTTHKTLRGPRGGMILCAQEWAEKIDRAVMPGIQGGPLMHIIAAKAVALGEALQPEFAEYQKHVIANAQNLAQALQKLGFTILTGGTDNHLLVVDLRNKNITGLDAQKALELAGITSSKSCIPQDPQKPWITSGIRFGMPAVTTAGAKPEHMGQIATWINDCVNNSQDVARLHSIAQQVKLFVESWQGDDCRLCKANPEMGALVTSKSKNELPF